MALNQIVKIRYADGREVALVDWTDTPLFSTIEVRHGATAEEMVFFQYTVGDPVPGYSPAPIGLRVASERDTNLAVPGAMASTEEFLIWSIRPEVFRLTLDFEAPVKDFATNGIPLTVPGIHASDPTPNIKMLDVLALRCLLDLEISQKFYSKASFGYYNWGAGAFSIGGTACNGGSTLGNKGLPSQEAVRRFGIPAHIGGQEKFRLSLKNPAGVALELGDIDSDCNSGAIAVQADVYARIVAHFDGLYKRPTS